MKIGICVSGLPRGEYYPYWIDFLSKKYDCTVFVNYWKFNPDIHNHSYAATNGFSFMEESFDESWYHFENAETIFTTNDWDIMRSIFAERLGKVESRYYGWTGSYNPQSMYYSIYKSFQSLEEYEKQKNLKFDVIIRSRFDVYVVDKFNYDLSNLDFDDNTVYTPGWNLTPINDCWGIGARKPMSIYHSLYEVMMDYIPAASNHPERLLQHHFEQHKINLKHIDFVQHIRINALCIPQNVKKKSKF
jgi:hypothetical protein